MTQRHECIWHNTVVGLDRIKASNDQYETFSEFQTSTVFFFKTYYKNTLYIILTLFIIEIKKAILFRK